MSRYHENVVWQTTTGEWRRAFFEVAWTGPAWPDNEYDIDFDRTRFCEVSPPCATEEEVYRWEFDLPNPGSSTTVTDPVEAARYDQMAATWDTDNPPVRVRTLGW